MNLSAQLNKRFVNGLDGSKGFKEHFDDQLVVFNHPLKKFKEYNDKIITIH